jgi:hypothetical protein
LYVVSNVTCNTANDNTDSVILFLVLAIFLLRLRTCGVDLGLPKFLIDF